QQPRAGGRDDGKANRVREFLAEYELQGGHVGPQPRRDLPGVPAIEELDVLPEQRLEDHPAQTEADAFGAQIEAGVSHRGRNRLDDQDADHDELELIEPIELTALHALIDDQPDDLRITEPGADAEEDEERTGQIQPPLGPEKGRDATQLRGQRLHTPIRVSRSSMIP